MTPNHSRLLPNFVLAAALLVACFSAPQAIAESPPKIDLEEAKAELAKAKLEASEAKKSEKETPRNRLFRRSSKKEDKADRESAPKSKTEKPDKQEDEPSKPRARLFKREKKSDTKAEKAPEPTSKPEADDSKERGGVFKRLSPFGRDGDKEETAEKEPTEKEAVVATEKAEDSDTKERKRLLGGLFGGKDSPDSPKNKSEKPDPVVAKKEKEPKKEKAGRSKGFGLFRGKAESKEFAKVDKTKLGKTIDPTPAKPAKSTGGALTKKSADTGSLGWYVVTDAKAPFYAVGPGQPMPPEKTLDRGSMLTVTKGGWGWCNVELGSGELGVVSAKAMRPATVAEVSRHTRPVATASRSRGARNLFNILGRGPAPKLDLPTSRGDGPIRNFGLLPPIDPSE